METEVIRMVRPSLLRKYNKSNGWYENWGELVKRYSVYALVLKGTVNVQGLIALRLDEETKATYVAWMVANPRSAGNITENKQYTGIGGHLFAIAADKSLEFGTGGEFYGFAMDRRLLEHYVDRFGAIPIGVLHQFHFIIDGEHARAIREEYTYEWTDEQL